MDTPNEHKLGPRLSCRLNAVPESAGADEVVEVFVEVSGEEAIARLRKQTHKLVPIVDGYCTATVPLSNICELSRDPDVIELEEVRYMQAQLNRSVPNIEGQSRARSSLTTETGAYDGKGVMIGIVDYGLDYRLDDFRLENGDTRIEFLWDQELGASTGENPPDKYGYGVEYKKEQLNAALRTGDHSVIQHNPLHAEEAISGHGTHVAGIAAGNGRTHDTEFQADQYIGVAPGATLVFVHLSRRDIRGHVDALHGTLANSIDLAHAIAYCFERAEEKNMPCVVNLSMGFNGGGHDGNMAVEWIIDALLQKSGRAVVIAAGNEDGENRRVHADGHLGEGAEIELEWQHGDEIGDMIYDDPSGNELEVWYPRGNAISICIVAPGDGQQTRRVEPGQTYEFPFDKGEIVTIRSDAGTPWNGAARIHIALSKGRREKGIRFGTWIVKLQAIHVTADEPSRTVRFDAWIERAIPETLPQYQRSRFKKYDPDTALTLSTPSTARRAITVGSYRNNGTSSAPASDFTGRGPTRDGRLKPEISAPGDPVTSSNARAGEDEDGNPRPARSSWSGTSMAAPHVTGVVARMLSRNRYLTADEIRDILVQTATPLKEGVRWDPKLGYGRLNAARAVELVDRLVGLRRV